MCDAYFWVGVALGFFGGIAAWELFRIATDPPARDSTKTTEG